ncbi:hypothetical protein D3C72_1906660 [compost metagenome]
MTDVGAVVDEHQSARLHQVDEAPAVVEHRSATGQRLAAVVEQGQQYPSGTPGPETQARHCPATGVQHTGTLVDIDVGRQALAVYLDRAFAIGGQRGDYRIAGVIGPHRPAGRAGLDPGSVGDREDREGVADRVGRGCDPGSMYRDTAAQAQVVVGVIAIAAVVQVQLGVAR